MRNIALFITTLFVFYSMLVVLWGEAFPVVVSKNLKYQLGSYGMMHTRVREAAQIGKVDILILGASDAYRGFDTRIFEEAGFKTFNLGSSSQSPLQTKWLLDKYLDVLNPDIVIYTASPFLMCSDGVESLLDIISNDKTNFATLGMALRVKNVKTLNTLIYCTYRQVLGFDSAYIEVKETNEDVYIKGGYVEKKHLDYKRDFSAVLGGEDRKYNDQQVDAFHKIISKIKDRKIKLYLVKTPIAHYYEYTHPLWPDIEEKLKATASYYNFNGALGFVDTLHFNDQYHLNQNGVEKFNWMVIDSLLR